MPVWNAGNPPPGLPDSLVDQIPVSAAGKVPKRELRGRLP